MFTCLFCQADTFGIKCLLQLCPRELLGLFGASHYRGHSEELVCDAVVNLAGHLDPCFFERLLKQVRITAKWIDLRIDERHWWQADQIGMDQIDTRVLFVLRFTERMFGEPLHHGLVQGLGVRTIDIGRRCEIARLRNWINRDDMQRHGQMLLACRHCGG